MNLTMLQISIGGIGLIALGLIIGRYVLNPDASKKPSPAAGLPSTMQQIFTLSLVIFIGIFITDWWFTRDKDLLNDTIVGVLIGAPIGWYGCTLAFYTTETEKKGVPPEERNENLWDTPTRPITPTPATPGQPPNQPPETVQPAQPTQPAPETRQPAQPESKQPTRCEDTDRGIP